MKKTVKVDFAIDDLRAIKIAGKLFDQFYNRKGVFEGYSMPEYVLPRNLKEGTREHAMTEYWMEENIRPVSHQDSDRLLIEDLEPIVDALKQKGVISWHFLREGDGWRETHQLKLQKDKILSQFLEFPFVISKPNMNTVTSKHLYNLLETLLFSIVKFRLCNPIRFSKN